MAFKTTFIHTMTKIIYSWDIIRESIDTSYALHVLMDHTQLNVVEKLTTRWKIRWWIHFKHNDTIGCTGIERVFKQYILCFHLFIFKIYFVEHPTRLLECLILLETFTTIHTLFAQIGLVKPLS